MKKTALNRIASFNSILTLTILLLFYLHSQILNHFYTGYDVFALKLSYFVNAFLAAFIYTVLVLLKCRFNEQLGFFFMAGSFLKFAAFFIFIYPILNKDFELTRLEFSMFFIPYIFSLILETVFLIKVLNTKD